MLYAILFKPTRSDLISTMTPDEEKLILEHYLYLKDLADKGKAKLVGRREDGEFGIAIVDYASQSEAEAFHKNDAAVKAGIFDVSVGAFRLSLGGFSQ